jgi:hypothetical protein
MAENSAIKASIIPSILHPERVDSKIDSKIDSKKHQNTTFTVKKFVEMHRKSSALIRA